MLGTWFYEHPYCTDSDIMLFLFLLTNVLLTTTATTYHSSVPCLWAGQVGHHGGADADVPLTDPPHDPEHQEPGEAPGHGPDRVGEDQTGLEGKGGKGGSGCCCCCRIGPFSESLSLAAATGLYNTV